MGPQALISYLGLLAQAGASGLLVLLFLLLRTHAQRRRYFQAWSLGWVALAVSLAALVARYELFPALPGVESRDLAVLTLYTAYQLGKLGFLAFLVAGTLLLAVGRLRRRVTLAVFAALPVYSVVSVALSPGLDGVVLWQAPWVIGAAGYCALRLAALPAGRQSLGTRLTAGVLAAMAALWSLYLVGFAQVVTREEGTAVGLLDALVRSNSYLDLLGSMLLAFGMVLILLEDQHREIDDAYGQLEVAYARLRGESLYDPLTGCLNRRALEERVGLDGVAGDYGAVAVLDLDNLKVVNDRWGHLAGDRLLQHFAAVLRDSVRPTDRIYRLGGDEFLLLLRRGRADRVATRLEELLGRAAPPPDDPTGGALQLEVSLGCADYDRVEDLPAAVQAADAAMYERKRSRKAERAAEPPRRPSRASGVFRAVTGG